MADRRFFEVAGPFTLGEIARLTGATLGDEGQSGRLMHDVAPLGSGAPDCLSFFDNRKYLAAFRETRAGAVLVSPAHAADAPEGTVALRTADPYLAYARAAAAFYPPERGDPSAPARIAAGAFVDATAKLGPGCSVGHGAVIEAGAEIGEGSSIGHHVVIGRGVVIGRDCRIDAQASVSHALIGDRVRLYPGVRIGQDGFGFASSAAGHVKVPQLGRVVIGDDVEIGANSAIDRGAGPDTVIGAGTIIDNLVQIGHNVVLGRACIIVAQVGIAGSTTLGNFVACGGQAGLNGHIKVGDGARIAAASAVVWDVDAGQTLFGVPALPMKQAMRQVAILDRMSKKKGDA